MNNRELVHHESHVGKDACMVVVKVFGAATLASQARRETELAYAASAERIEAAKRACAARREKKMKGHTL
jgi:hypothetical protein